MSYEQLVHLSFSYVLNVPALFFCCPFRSRSLSLSALAFKREVAFVSIQRILDHKPMSPNLYKRHRLCYHVICTPLATKTFIKCNSLSLRGTKYKRIQRIQSHRAKYCGNSWLFFCLIKSWPLSSS